MRVRSVLFASVCAVSLAASAAVPVVANASKSQAAISSEKAYKALVSGRSMDAIRLYAEAIESRQLGPELLANSLLNRALAYQNVGQHQDAIDDYSAALRVDAMSAKLRAVALYNRGLSFQKIQKPAMAIEDFTSALFLDAEFSQAYYGRGNVLRRSGQFLFALSDYEKSVKYSHPQPYLPLYGAALTYEALRRPNEAQKALVHALTLKPDFQAARAKLSVLLRPQPDTPVGGAGPVQKVSAEQVVATATPQKDTIVTGSVASDDPDLVRRKKALPAPVSPPAAMQQAAKIVPATVNVTTQPQVKVVAMKAPALTDELPTSENSGATNQKRRKPTGWAVQLSSQKREDSAWSVWKKMQAKHRRLLGKHDANVVRADLGDRGIFYRLRVTGLDNKRQARRLCSRLKKRGTSCFIASPNS